MEEGHTVHLVYLDFAKAFDSAHHQFLLTKLMETSSPYLEHAGKAVLAQHPGRIMNNGERDINISELHIWKESCHVLLVFKL